MWILSVHLKEYILPLVYLVFMSSSGEVEIIILFKKPDQNVIDSRKSLFDVDDSPLQSASGPFPRIRRADWILLGLAWFFVNLSFTLHLARWSMPGVIWWECCELASGPRVRHVVWWEWQVRWLPWTGQLGVCSEERWWSAGQEETLFFLSQIHTNTLFNTCGIKGTSNAMYFSYSSHYAEQLSIHFTLWVALPPAKPPTSMALFEFSKPMSMKNAPFLQDGTLLP